MTFSQNLRLKVEWHFLQVSEIRKSKSQLSGALSEKLPQSARYNILSESSEFATNVFSGFGPFSKYPSIKGYIIYRILFRSNIHVWYWHESILTTRFGQNPPLSRTTVYFRSLGPFTFIGDNARRSFTFISNKHLI